MKKNPNVRAKVENILYEWRREVGLLSSTTEMIANSWYQALIELGQEAIPFLVAEENGHLHHALKAITGEDPTDEEDAGDIDAHARSWKAWLIAKELRERYPAEHIVFGVNLEPFEFTSRNDNTIVWMGENDQLDIRISHSSYFGKRKHEYLEVSLFIEGPEKKEEKLHFIVNQWESLEDEILHSFDEAEDAYIHKIAEATRKLVEYRANRKLVESLK